MGNMINVEVNNIKLANLKFGEFNGKLYFQIIGSHSRQNPTEFFLTKESAVKLRELLDDYLTMKNK